MHFSSTLRIKVHDLHVPAVLPLGRSPMYPLGRNLGGSQGLPRHWSREESVAPTVVCTLVTLPTEPSRLLTLNKSGYRGTLQFMLFISYY
jgi:hypothetical protein